MKYLITYFFIVTIYCSFADVPGNKGRPSYDVKISGPQQYGNYTFYLQGYDTNTVLKENDALHIEGGYGAPQCENVWAVDNKTGKHTDTVYYCSGDSKKDISVVLKIDSTSSRLYSVITKSSKKDEGIPLSSGSSIGTPPDPQTEKNKSIMYLISGLSFIILIALVILVWNKNRKTKVQQPV